MNVMATPPTREPLKLTAFKFRVLRGFGAFDDYWKVELLDGELWGQPATGYDEPESDAVHRIKLTIANYDLLARAGAFEDVRKTELIDGLVYSMRPQYRPHGFVKDQLAFRLNAALRTIGHPLQVATEQSMAIPNIHEPQPDIMLSREPEGEGAIPASSVELIVEVADTTLRFDLKQKQSIYAFAGIPEYWVEDVTGRTVRQLWTLADGLYQEHRDIPFGEPVTAATIPDLTVATDRL